MFTSLSEFSSILEKLVKNKKVSELVRKMEPLDLVHAFSDLGLKPHDAAKATLDLLRKVDDGIMYPSIETNKQYPVPSQIRKDPPEELQEFSGADKTSFGHGDADDYNKVPPQPRGRPSDFPYDSMTVNSMAPGAQGRRKGRYY